MARFYGTVKGQAKGTASRRGSYDSGLVTHTNGWGAGVKVTAYPDNISGEDNFEIVLDYGSSQEGGEIILGTYFVRPQTGERVFVVTDAGNEIMR